MFRFSFSSLLSFFVAWQARSKPAHASISVRLPLHVWSFLNSTPTPTLLKLKVKNQSDPNYVASRLTQGIEPEGAGRRGTMKFGIQSLGKTGTKKLGQRFFCWRLALIGDPVAANLLSRSRELSIVGPTLSRPSHGFQKGEDVSCN